MEEKNNKLPADVQYRIKADAKKRYPLYSQENNRIGYIAGATAEHAQNESVRLQLEAQDANVEILLNQKKELIDRSQVLVDALEAIIRMSNAGKTLPHIDSHVAAKARKALQQWKEGKEVGDGRG